MAEDAATAAEDDLMQKLVSLCKRRGFVFQSSEIYGGLRSAYDYGPMGVELKRNLMEEWWRQMVHGREDIVGIDASIKARITTIAVGITIPSAAHTSNRRPTLRTWRTFSGV